MLATCPVEPISGVVTSTKSLCREWFTLMNQSMREHTGNLRKALLKLPATGAAGFEGLLAVALTEITSVPFRLAGSGSQFGLDGKAAYEDDAVCFEAKRYSGKIPRTEVLSNLAELSIGDNGDIDRAYPVVTHTHYM